MPQMSELDASPERSNTIADPRLENVKENSDGLIDLQVSKMLDDPIEDSNQSIKLTQMNPAD